MALTDKLTAIANSVRGKTGESKKYSLTEMPTEIDKMGSAEDFENYKKLISHEITSVVIPDGITKIGWGVFQYCTNLTSITIPNSVTSIDKMAVANCAKLASLTIPESITSIGDYAVQYATSLTSLTIPGNVTSIGKYAFQYCTSLTSAVIGNGVTSIDNGIFASCTSLTSLTIPASVASLGKYAVLNCESLKDVTLGDGFQASIDLSSSTQYTADTIVGWLNALSDRTGQTALTLTMGETNLAKLTDEQKAIATDKNWNLA